MQLRFLMDSISGHQCLLQPDLTHAEGLVKTVLGCLLVNFIGILGIQNLNQDLVGDLGIIEFLI